jgi:Flp pilus assembly secretin CpaC
MTRFLLAAVFVLSVLPCPAPAQDEVPPPQVEVHLSVVYFPMKTIQRHPSVREHAILPHSDVDALWKAGEGEWQHALSLVTRSGVAAEVQQVQEIVYPTEYEMAPAGDPEDKAGQKVLPLMRPSEFKTRKVGYILNVTPTVSTDGQLIDVVLAPEHAELEDWADVAPDIDGSAFGSIEVDVATPIFASLNLTSHVLVRDGETVIIGGSPSKDGDGMNYMILSASVR